MFQSSVPGSGFRSIDIPEDKVLKAATAPSKRDDGLRAASGIGVGRSGGWPVAISLLVFDVTKPRAARIGRRWRQNAVVVVARGQKVALLPLR